MLLDLKRFGVPKSHIVPIANILGRKWPKFKLVPGQWLFTTHDGGQVYDPRPTTNGSRNCFLWRHEKRKDHWYR